MSSLRKKKLAFMALVNKIKGFVRRVSGTPPLTLIDCIDNSLLDYTIYGNSTQRTTGKNLFDKSISIQDPIKNETELPNTIYGYSILETNKICDILKPNTTYTISCEIECTAIPNDCTYSTGILGFLIYKTVSGYTSISLYIDHQLSVGEKYQYTKTFTTPLKFDSGGNYELLCYMNKYLNSNNKSVTASVIYRNIQIEEGSTATDYEAYHTSPSPDFPSAVESVGDLTTKNLFDGQSAVLSNAVLNDDGTITILSNSNNIDIYLKAGTYTIKIDADFSANIFLREGQVASGYITIIQSGSVKSFTLTSDNYLRISSFAKNGTYNSIMLVEGSYTSDTMPSYEPYHKYDVPVTVCGKNILPYPYTDTTRTISGITFTDNKDGTITLNGTSAFSTTTSIADFYLCRTVSISAGTYTLSGCPSGGSTYKYRLMISIKDGEGKTTYSSDVGQGYSFTVNTDVFVTLSIRIGGEIGTVSNLVFKPQIEEGATATSYEPYKGKTTTHIYLDEPLRKVGDYADYIDFKNQKVLRNIKEVTFDGSEAWNPHDKFIYLHIADLRSSPVGLSTHIVFNATSGIYFYATSKVLRLYQSSDNILYPSVDDWKSKLAEWNTEGNPLTVYYILTEPTEESITIPNLTIPQSEKATIDVDTAIKPSTMSVEYYSTSKEE